MPPVLESLRRRLNVIAYLRVSRDKHRKHNRRNVDKQVGSVSDQEVEAQEHCDEEDWNLDEIRSDSVSASRFSNAPRPGWDSTVDELPSGRWQVVWLWESSRGDRRLGRWSDFLDICRDHAILIYIRDHDYLYDVRKYRDWEILANEGVKNARESEKLSVRTGRGKRKILRGGRPDGRATWGYAREYDPETGEFVREVLVPKLAATAEHIHRAYYADPNIAGIERQLRADGWPTMTPGVEWHRNSIRRVLVNLHYIGKRRDRDGNIVDGAWPLLSDAPDWPKVFWANWRKLHDPARQKHRPGKQRHLLTYWAECGVCGATIRTDLAGTGRRRHDLYVSYPCGHVGVRQDWVDDYVSSLVVARYSRDDIVSDLAQNAEHQSAELAEAEAELAEVERDLEEYYAEATARRLSAAGLARVEGPLLEQKEQLGERITRLSVPPVLSELFDPEKSVAEVWAGMAAAGRVTSMRDILKYTFEYVKILPAKRRTVDALDRDRIAYEWRRASS